MMQLTVNIDDSIIDPNTFNDLLKSLPQDKVQEILLECVAEYFRKDNYKAIENLLYSKGNDYYGQRVQYTEFAKKIIESTDCSGIQDVMDKCVDHIKNNYDTLLREAISDMIVSGLTNKYLFQDSLKSTIDQKIYELKNNNISH